MAHGVYKVVKNVFKMAEFLTVTTYSTPDVSPAVFQIFTHFASQQLVFPTPPLFDSLWWRNAVQYQLNLYTTEKYI